MNGVLRREAALKLLSVDVVESVIGRTVLAAVEWVRPSRDKGRDVNGRLATMVLLCALGGVAACGGDQDGETSPSSQHPSAAAGLQLQPLLTNLDFPVGLAQAPDGRVFFNERLTGNIRIVTPQWQLAASPFCRLTVSSNGEQGLLGLTLDPDFSTNRFVYVYDTAAGPLRNRVVRYTDVGGRCDHETVILDNLPANIVHNGGAITFGPDGKLYVMIGDAQNPADAQDVTTLAGKVLRVNTDGSAPSDNPFITHSNVNARKVFSFGHRNSFGLTFHGLTGDLWEAENGPEDNDEINRVVAGGNYGWPMVRGIAGHPNFHDPILTFTPPIAPTAILSLPAATAVYPADYRNTLLFADFNEGKIRRVVLAGGNLDQLGVSTIVYDGGHGGLLSLMLGADGYGYVSNQTTIFRIIPQ